MNIKVQLNANDYLTYQLFAASQSKPIIKRRKLEWLFSTLFFFILAAIFLLTHISVLAYYFVAVGVLNVIFFPAYTRRKYKKHYKRHIRDIYKNIINKQASINFEEEVITTKDADSEAKFNYNQLKEISEIPEYFFVHFISGTALIIPKRACEDVYEVKNFLVALAQKQAVNYSLLLNWKWK